MLVVDAGVALSAARSPAARDRLVAHDLVAPPLLWSEVHSALHEGLWRREIDARGADEVRSGFVRLPIRRRRPTRLYGVAWEMAEALGWAKTYDAEYLALADLEGCRLVTLDARLRRGADRTGLVIGPAELP
jgi:predicted nucleic acid-binding protein